MRGVLRAMGGFLLEGFDNDGGAAFVRADDDGAEEGVVGNRDL
jgi:hypothetical protein